MEKFKHSPLDLDRPAIRLLQLRQGIGSSIECELFQAYLDDEHNDLIPYEALSYTWGGTAMHAAVKIDSSDHEVTENLYLALQHLRLADRDRILWVDALCIDQSNMKERGHQVEQMGNIYSRAHRVLVWLGLGTTNTALLLDNLGQLHKLGMRSWALTDPRWFEAWSVLTHGWVVSHWNLKHRQKGGLQSLLSHPWFKRVWILQEVANSRRATIYVGEKSIPAQMLALAPRLMGTSPEAHCQAALDIMPGQARERSWWSKNRDLCTLLRKFNSSEASDARDRIYALFGMCSDNEGMHADYTKSLSQVIHDTAIFLFDLVPRAQHYTIVDDIPCAIRENVQTLAVLVQSKNLNWIDAYVRSRPNEPSFGTAELEAASKNETWGHEIVQYLLRSTMIHVRLSQSMLVVAARDSLRNAHPLRVLYERFGEEMLLLCAASCPPDILTLLFNDSEIKIHITAQLLSAAASNPNTGVEVTGLLLDRSIDGCDITPGIIEHAARNIVCGPAVMNLIVQHLARFGKQLIVDHGLVELLDLNNRRLEIWIVLLRADQSVINITDEALTTFADSQTWILSPKTSQNSASHPQSWDRLGADAPGVLTAKDSCVELQIWSLIVAWLEDKSPNEQTLKALAANDEWASDALLMLLRHRQFEAAITKQVLVAAIMNMQRPDDLIHSLWEHRRSQANNIESDAFGVRKAEPVLQPHSLDLIITSRVVEALATTLLSTHSLLDHLAEYSSTLGVTERAFVMAKNIVRSLARALWWAYNSNAARFHRMRVLPDRFRFFAIDPPPPPEWDQEARWEDVSWTNEAWYSRFDSKWEPCLNQSPVHVEHLNTLLDDMPCVMVGRYSEMDRKGRSFKFCRSLKVFVRTSGDRNMEQMWGKETEEQRYIERLYDDWVIFAKRLHAALEMSS